LGERARKWKRNEVEMVMNEIELSGPGRELPQRDRPEWGEILVVRVVPQCLIYDWDEPS
jgi:hypothetical protein